MPSYVRHLKSGVNSEQAAEIEEVNKLAECLINHLESSVEIIAALHIYGAQSKAIQDNVGCC